MNRRTITTILCLISFQTAMSLEYCLSENTPSIKLCHQGSLTGNVVYLDAGGVQVGETPFCTCTLSSSDKHWNVSVTPLSDDPGYLSMAIDGQFINNTGKSVSIFPYINVQTISFNKSTSMVQVQCYEINGYPKKNGNNDIEMTITCFTAGSSTEIKPVTSKTVPEPTTGQLSTTESVGFSTTTGNNYIEGDGDRKLDETDSGNTNTGVIAGSGAGALVVVVIAIVLTVYLCRRNRRNGKTEGTDQSANKKDLNYDMSVNEGYIPAICQRETPSKQSSSSNNTDAVTYSVVNKHSNRPHSAATLECSTDDDYNRLNVVVNKSKSDNVYNTASTTLAVQHENNTDNYNHVGDVQQWNARENLYNTLDNKKL